MSVSRLGIRKRGNILTLRGSQLKCLTLRWGMTNIVNPSRSRGGRSGGGLFPLPDAEGRMLGSQVAKVDPLTAAQETATL